APAGPTPPLALRLPCPSVTSARWTWPGAGVWRAGTDIQAYRHATRHDPPALLPRLGSMPAATPGPGAGRYAPSPSGDLHLGNLRTALLAWALARRTDRAFHLRVEDLDRVQQGAAQRQLEDLEALGLDWDGEVVRQSERGADHEAAIGSLTAQGLVYEC